MERKQYQTPQLIEHGAVEELTEGYFGGYSETFFGSDIGDCAIEADVGSVYQCGDIGS